MKQPGATAYLFGNPLSLLALVLAMFCTGYNALTGNGSGWLAIAALVAVSYSVNSSRQITAYARWKREWDAMSGNPPRQPLYARHPWLRYVVGGSAWVFGAWMAFTTTDRALQWAVAVFWLGTVLGIGVLLFRLAKSLGRSVKHAMPKQKMVVTVCPVVPMRSMNASDACQLLPNYCRSLLS
ncbi:hypothetical protein [Asticcacaulis sp. EMRT-3]|uniref:hypothetical protein n=1 Tax=Asticcacaulis sp. EMRT-3 TaxID=3040349 RepID=UPI0024AEBEB1|nr:hypothetical protein [Asticcacaulis sp. EMRT-3]MDI7774687.1 hypothetical protein [Asticcacaulis sp. EMRT-3]